MRRPRMGSHAVERVMAQRFWEYTSPAWAMKFLDAWCTRIMRSRIGPMKKIAGSRQKPPHGSAAEGAARGRLVSS